LKNNEPISAVNYLRQPGSSLEEIIRQINLPVSLTDEEKGTLRLKLNMKAISKSRKERLKG